MNIAELEQAGGFVVVDAAPEKRTIEWNGNAATVFVRRASFGRITALLTLPASDYSVELVRECIRLGDNGDEQLTRAQVESLAPSLATAFLTAVAEVNALSKDATDPKS